MCTRRRETLWVLGVFVVGLAVVGGSATALGIPASVFRPPPGLGPVDITIVYDDSSFNPNVPAGAWNDLSILIESGGRMVLFDCGDDPVRLLANLRLLGKDPRRLDAVVIDHLELGHWRGLPALLALKPDLRVFLPAPLTPEAMPGGARPPVNAVVATGPVEVVPGIITTGLMPSGSGVTAQSLVVQTPHGPVLVGGCGTEDWVFLARRVAVMTGIPPLLAMNLCVGDEQKLGGARQRETAALRGLGVTYVALAHCSAHEGPARKGFEEVWGPACLHVGTGALIRFTPEAGIPAVVQAPVVAARDAAQGPTPPARVAPPA